ncbi:MAP kinase kinase (MEK) [Marasmius tenuissimus]|uniref:MAP kinase kinase (MEK) n=1 Tax=Marasmius tenuissimus TaxID=585030 RepID=A0ABR2ZCC2_9AGAR
MSAPPPLPPINGHGIEGSGSLSKKRNIKSLQLPTATRQAPRGPRPPLITTASSSRLPSISHPDNDVDPLSPESSTAQRKRLQAAIEEMEKMDMNDKTKVNGDGDGASGTSSKSGSQNGSHGRRRILESLPKPEELKNIAELGMGNGGSVMKVEHVPSGIIMAKKVVLIDAKPSVRKQILRELHIMHLCDSPHIVSSYGAFLQDPNICICMEFMDKKSFDGIYKRTGAIDIDVVGKVAESVLKGLLYLYDEHHIIHRDIKPSNILLNSEGDVKLCDFGVSGELINSLANTFVGTSIYMSPERIQGAEYSIRSDVWSLGITIVELAHGRFPFADYSDDLNSAITPGGLGLPFSANANGSSRPNSLVIPSREEKEKELPRVDEEKELPPLPPDAQPPVPAPSSTLPVPSAGGQGSTRRRSRGVSLHGGAMTMSILELMHLIVREPAPRLKEDGGFPEESCGFVDACLDKDYEKRKTPRDLLAYPWFGIERVRRVDMKVWAATV